MLFPPIVAAGQNAFPYTKSVNIYFQLSQFNSLSSIAQVQLTVKYQTNNRNALNTNKYPNKIKCTTIHHIQSDGVTLYYVTLDPSDLVQSPFDPDMIYKVQLRFSGRAWPSNAAAANLSSDVSEWSTVTLIKPIVPPQIYITNFMDADSSITNTYGSAEPIFVGVYDPNNTRNGKQTLKTWRIKLYNEQGNELLADSGEQIANVFTSVNGKTQMECQLRYTMKNNAHYTLTYEIQTRNGYKDSISYKFQVITFASSPLNGTVELQINQEDGYAAVVVNAVFTARGNNITLRRTSSESQFQIWQDVANYTTIDSTIRWEFDDFTIKSGVFYQYGAQLRQKGRRGSLVTSSKQMGQFDDAFLVEKGGSKSQALQLKLRYDTNIANASINIGESKTDTIGSKYPYVRRNGNMYYHSFPLSGLITACMDNNNLFTNEDELLDNETSLYKQAHGSHTLNVISGEYDYTLQREFREKVKTFLYDNKPKLFKSLTQGNILIKLMGITLTPKQELGRLLYSFDCTAIEIDEPTIQNFDKYNIQKIGAPQNSITWSQTTLGQLNRFKYSEDGSIQEQAYPANFNLLGTSGIKSNIETIKSKYHVGESVNDILINDFSISYMRIEIDSEPYLINNNNGVLSPFVEGVDTVDENTLLGTLININGQNILIEPPNNIYQIRGSDVSITSSWNITPLKDTKILLDFVIELSEEKDTSNIANSLIYKSVMGQLFGNFNSKSSLWNTIYQKYHEDLDEYYLKVNSLKNIDVEANQGTIIYVQTKADSNYQKLIIDETNQLFIDPGDNTSTITDAYFYGVSIEARKLNNHQGMINSSKPTVVTQLSAYEDGVAHIFYNGKWWPAAYLPNTKTYEIACPVNAIVNYQIETQKGIY